TVSWRFSTQLAAQIASNNGAGWAKSRQIATWNPSTRAAVAFSYAALSSTQQGQLVTGTTPGNDASAYLNYLRGDSTNEQGSTAAGSTQAYRSRANPVGDIVGSKLRPVGPPSFPFSDAANPGYASFKSTSSGRKTVVYVGANDGMMHAIDGSPTSGGGGGTELFAYVPGALFAGPSAPTQPRLDGLASLGNPAFIHHYLVNATPNQYDVDFARVPSAGGAMQTGTPDWRSVLIGGLGKGGRAYYAIDVTHPESMASDSAVASNVLWEFTHPLLGYTYGDAMMVKVKKYGWVTVFTSGYDNADGVGYFFIVNPKTGQLLEPPIPTGAGSTTRDAGLAQANAFVVDSTDGTADSVYAGDLLGNLWRLDLTALPGTGNYAAPIKLATFADAGGTPQPVTARPVIEVHPRTKKRFVMVGTGRLLHTTDILSTQAQTFYAITDGSNARFNTSTDLPAGIAFPITRGKLGNGGVGKPFDPTTQMGWAIDLGNATSGPQASYRVILDATSLAGTVSFAAVLPGGDACNPSGTTAVYDLDYASSASQFKTTDGSPLLFTNISSLVTDLRFTSVGGTAELLYGTDKGKVGTLATQPLQALSVRRLNWRELQNVD
ncbi:MAG: PilC/PilY family type IV pilus protein, partial [Actinomycetota bacterium]|nr:PilC/PilY family type IV pilus protein [Actinomycetota bacterium]